MRINDEVDVCTICNRPYKWSKRYWACAYEDLKEMEMVTAHAGCRSRMRILREKEAKLRAELVSVEWEMLNLRWR